MKKLVVSKKQMYDLDERTCKVNDISSYDLMKQASNSMFLHIKKTKFIDKNTDNIVIVAGIGNNGGDALVIGKSLKNDGYNVTIFIVGNIDKQSPENKLASSELDEINYISNENGLKDFKDKLLRANYLIDGLFGIGVKGDISGIYFDVITLINKSNAYVFSIDIPSGLNSNNGILSNVAIYANNTMIVEHYKRGNLMGDALDYSGQLSLIDAGIIYDKNNKSYLLDNKDLVIEKRKHNSHKYHYGTVLTIGGSKGMMGAPILSSTSALRSGSGLVFINTLDKYTPYIKNPYPEIMIDTHTHIDDIIEKTEKKSAVIFGVGLGRKDYISAQIIEYLVQTNIPLVIDADGIYYLKDNLNKITNPNIVITPHTGEMALLCKVSVKEILENPIHFINDLTSKYNITVILKGACTIVSDGNETYYSILGNPGLASAGSGDVLSGILGNFLGRKMKPIRAAKKALYIHSKAAQIAKELYGEESMIATDIINQIYKVIKELKL